MLERKKVTIHSQKASNSKSTTQVDHPSRPPKSDIPTNPVDKKIWLVLEFCRFPRSLNEIMAMLEMDSRKWVREKYVLPLLGTKLELTIPDKPNSRLQKYRTIVQ